MTISEIQELQDGMHVDRLQGKLIKVFEREQKTDKKNRPYTLQNGEVEEGGSSIRVSFWNHKDLSSYRGQIVVIRSVPPKSFVSVSHYKDKAQLSVPGQAIVLSESEETDDIPMDYPTDTPKPQQNAPQVNVAPKKAIPADGVQEAKKRVMQYVNLRYITDEAADFICQGSISADLKKDVSSCFFIQGIRDGLHLKLPDSKPLLQPREATEGQEKLDKALNEMFPQDQEF